MPIYEYECRECGLRFDILQKLGEPGPGSCPQGHRGVHRLFSQPAIIFKGSGFYVTDNGRSGRNGSTGSKKAAESKTAASVAADRKADGVED